MFIIKVSPQGIEGIELDCAGVPDLEDYGLILMWPIIRKHLGRMASELEQIYENFQKNIEIVVAQEAVEGKKKEGEGDGKGM